MNAHTAVPPPLMPYGAPELKSAARRLLIRAIVTGSAMWTVLFLIALAASMMWLKSSPPPRELPMPKFDLIQPPPPLLMENFARRPIAPPSTVRPTSGTFVPAIEPEKLEQVITPPGTVFDPNAEASDALPGSVTPSTAPVAPVEVLPKPDDPVNVDQLPDLVKMVEPVYPELAKDAGAEGKLIVRALIGKDGRVIDAFVPPKYSNLLLDEAALTAIRKWVFTPALTNNRPVPVWIAVPVKFTLRR